MPFSSMSSLDSPHRRDVAKATGQSEPRSLVDRTTVVRAQYFDSGCSLDDFPESFTPSCIHTLAIAYGVCARGGVGEEEKERGGGMCIHALDFGYSHVTCFGQWHMSGSDCGPVLSTGFKGSGTFLVVFLQPGHHRAHALGSPLVLRGGRQEPPQLSPT